MSDFKNSFFRQSGWMVIATTASGVLFFLVHKFAGKMPKAEYGVFTTLLQVINLMGIPSGALATVFAQQAAGAVSDADRRQLAGTVRAVALGTFGIWLVMAAGALLFQGQILEQLKITHASALWITLVFALSQLWLPIATGVLQGTQNFLWLGGSAIVNSGIRLAAVFVIVVLLGGGAAGAMGAALAGMAVAMGLAAWQARGAFAGPRDPFDARAWLRRVLPLTFGLGAAMFMLSADMIVVQSVFDKEQTGYYAAAGMIGRALIFFTAPLTMVMFPKIVQSAARAEKTDVLGLTVGVTALMGACAAGLCTLFPTLPLRIIYDATFIEKAGPLVPWFAWCMAPLTVAIVLINNLLARQRFAAVPWLVAVAVGYGIALRMFATSFEHVIAVIGVFSVILLGVCSWFSWRK
ncbi:MAG: hypothetical protein HY301_13720 [Verrucomicrobia bacterium]|nr:hypothetical protein [Verrucomicrobiota bacterium]